MNVNLSMGVNADVIVAAGVNGNAILIVIISVDSKWQKKRGAYSRRC